MSKAFSAFYDALLPELPGCTTAMVDHHLRAVARDFCDRTSAWRGEFDPIPMAADTLTYDLITPEANTDVVRLLRLTVATTLVWSASQADSDDCDQPRYPPHKPPFTVDLENEQITLTEQPDGDIVLVGAFKPKPNVTVLPDVLFNQHLEAMRVGTLSRLMKLGGKKWTDRDLAMAYQADFDAYMNHAALTAARGNTRAPLRTRPINL